MKLKAAWTKSFLVVTTALWLSGCNVDTFTEIADDFAPGLSFEPCQLTQLTAPPYISGLSQVPDGSAQKPFLICTKAQLDAIAADTSVWDKHFKLLQDINMDNSGVNNGMIGSAATNFTGSFDGGGKTVSNFRFIDNTQSNVGFFGAINAPAVISNLTITSITVDGDDNVGALVGTANGGTISDCHIEGNVNGTNADSDLIGGLVGLATASISNSTTSVAMSVNDDNVGGLAGRLGTQGTISNCTTQGTITVSANGQQIGGLVGDNQGLINIATSTAGVSGGNFEVGGLVGKNSATITFTAASGKITSGAVNVAGLVGQNLAGATIQSSSASGLITQFGGESATGGLVGINEGNLLDSFSTSDVTSNGQRVGGIAGRSAATSIINNCYSTGVVVGSKSVGGLVGESLGTLSNSYKTKGHVIGTAITDTLLKVGGGIGIASAGLIENVYITVSVAGTQANSNKVGGFAGEAGGSGLINNSWSSGDVKGLGNSVAGFAGVTSNTKIRNVYAIGTVSAPDAAAKAGGLYSSNFGDNTYTDAYVLGNVESGDTAGGFGDIKNDLTVVSHSFTFASVRNEAGEVGGFADRARDNSTVSLSYSAGNVYTNTGTAGGFFGRITDTAKVFNSAAYGKVIARGAASRLGGFIARATVGGSIRFSFSLGIASSPGNEVGGFVGRAAAGSFIDNFSRGDVKTGTGADIGGFMGRGGITLTNAYSTASITGGAADVGGFIGQQDAGSVLSGNYWDGDKTAGSFLDIGDDGDDVNITSFPTAQMFQQATYAGFDFANDWVMPLGADGNGYPKLKNHYMCYGGFLAGAPYANSASFPAGTKRDPNIICTAAQFQAIAANSGDWGEWFLLQEDINFAGANLTPIGSSATPFSGTFDGRGHTLSNFTINSAANDDVGLWGFIQGELGPDNVDFVGDGTIMHLNVHTATITGTNNVGTVAGTLGTGRILLVNVTGTTTVNGSNQVGGLVGISTKAYHTLDANTTAITDMGSFVQRAGNFSNVTGTGDQVGGIIGQNAGRLEYTFNKGVISGSSAVGGVAGTNDGEVLNSYGEFNSLTFASRGGGVVGNNTATITHCFSAGAIPSAVGANVGNVKQTFFDDSLDTLNNGNSTAKTTAEMQTEGTFTGPEGRWSTGKWIFFPGQYPDLLSE